MKLKMCHRCRGNKEVLGFGMMGMEKCGACKGVGAIPDIEEQELDAILDATRPAIVDIEDEVMQDVTQVIETRKQDECKKTVKRSSRAKAKTNKETASKS